MRLLFCAVSLLALSASAASAQDVDAAFADNTVSTESLQAVRGKHVAQGLKDAVTKSAGGIGSIASSDLSMPAGDSGTGQQSFTDSALDGGFTPPPVSPSATSQNAGNTSSMGDGIRAGMLGIVTGVSSSAVTPR